jgi:hypothetical protein
MTTLFNSAAPVNPTRPFGAGILPRTPRTFEPSPEDRVWWAQECERLDTARENARFDHMAAESAALERHERGLCC